MTMESTQKLVRSPSASITKTTIAAALLTAGMAAHAAPIDGSMSIVGDFDPDTGDLSTADGIDFLGDDFTVGSDPGDATGDFSSLVGSTGSIQDFTFDPFAGPIADFWTVGDFSFDLESATVELQDDDFLIISGQGTIAGGTGFDPTPGEFNFSGQTASDSTFTFSASAASQVPEPGTALLLGTGLFGLVMSRRARAKA